jgi:hypothetical protein
MSKVRNVWLDISTDTLLLVPKLWAEREAQAPFSFFDVIFISGLFSLGPSPLQLNSKGFKAPILSEHQPHNFCRLGGNAPTSFSE